MVFVQVTCAFPLTSTRSCGFCMVSESAPKLLGQCEATLIVSDHPQNLHIYRHFQEILVKHICLDTQIPQYVQVIFTLYTRV